MPLKKGTGSVKYNVKELVTTKPSKSRSKGIRTLAKKRGISLKEAKMKQALAIAYSQAKK